jgi:acetoin utilization deacetylase AcuC-like enzyme
MPRTAVLIDSRFREHDPGAGHPERPDRIAVLEALVNDWHGAPFERLRPRLADPAELLYAHTSDLIEKVRATEGRTRSRIDPDTTTSARSFEVALLATGGLLELVESVASGVVQNGLAFVRPPGHHATAERAMGFCLFNNVAVAAHALRRRHGYQRIAIVDFDLHHGNGTEAIFYDDPGVLYLSLHQYPYYPGTGAASDVGTGAGEGFTVNIPFSAGVGDPGYVLAFDHIVLPVLRQYAPQFVLVSAGFDCHARDPLGGMRVSESGFAEMTHRLLAVAHEVAGGRIAGVLEGGYDLDAIRGSAEAVLTEMSRPLRALAPPSSPSDALEPLKQLLRPYWQI